MTSDAPNNAKPGGKYACLARVASRVYLMVYILICLTLIVVGGYMLCVSSVTLCCHVPDDNSVYSAACKMTGNMETPIWVVFPSHLYQIRQSVCNSTISAHPKTEDAIVRDQSIAVAIDILTDPTKTTRLLHGMMGAINFIEWLAERSRKGDDVKIRIGDVYESLKFEVIQNKNPVAQQSTSNNSPEQT